MTKKIKHAAELAFFLSINDSMWEFMRVDAAIATKNFSMGWSSPVESCKLTALGQKKDNPADYLNGRLYAVEFCSNSSINLQNAHLFAELFAAVGKNLESVLRKSATPATFGDNVFLLGLALGIDSVYILKKSRMNGGYIVEDKADNYVQYSLKDAVYAINSRIMDYYPHITKSDALDVRKNIASV